MSGILLKRFGERRQRWQWESSKRIKTVICANIVATIIKNMKWSTFILLCQVDLLLPKFACARSKSFSYKNSLIASHDSGHFERMYRLEFYAFNEFWFASIHQCGRKYWQHGYHWSSLYFVSRWCNFLHLAFLHLVTMLLTTTFTTFSLKPSKPLTIVRIYFSMTSDSQKQESS